MHFISACFLNLEPCIDDKLASLALTCPTNTADCERSFSVQNYITCQRRASISAITCDHLMRVCICGPSMQQMNFENAVNIWKKKKTGSSLQKVNYKHIYVCVKYTTKISIVFSFICLGPSFQKMTPHFLLHGSLGPTTLEKNLKHCDLSVQVAGNDFTLISLYR